ncbi:MAG: hypothetical protein KDJ41_19810 [Hyphomicrobiaceae bacterium]|mgnify:CR=1 FL=1|nr:hypothetical protein [Hyphomicrobiaceae bacterium]
MKTLAVLLAIIAAGKFGYQEYLYRAAAEEAIVAAYRSHAIESCDRAAKAAQTPLALSQPSRIALRIGRRREDVMIWQVDHAGWHDRYRAAYLELSFGHTTRVACEYDLRTSIAALRRT